MSIQLSQARPFDGSSLSDFDRSQADSQTSLAGATERCLEKMIAQAIGVDALARDENIWDAGLDSMQAISLIVQIEKQLNFKASVGMLLERSTIKGLGEMINQPRAVTPTGLVAMQTSTSGLPPLFLMHMSGGDLTCYAKLTARLGDGRTIYGMVPPDQHPISMEELAAQHVRSIRAVQPVGPYHIAGHCFGGLLAYEVARQIMAAGEKVAFLAVVDFPFSVSGDPIRFRWNPGSLAKFANNLSSWAWNIARLESQERSKMVSQKLGFAKMRIRHFFDKNAPLPGQALEACPEGVRPELWLAHEQAWRTYRPGAYSGKLTLMRLKYLPILQPYDQTLGWKSVAADIDLQLIPGPTHGDALRPSYVGIFANQILALLSART